MYLRLLDTDAHTGENGGLFIYNSFLYLDTVSYCMIPLA